MDQNFVILIALCVVVVIALLAYRVYVAYDKSSGLAKEKYVTEEEKEFLNELAAKIYTDTKRDIARDKKLYGIGGVN